MRLGTEGISSEDGTIAALPGASPGASTAAPIMLSLMQKAFKDRVSTAERQAKLKQIIPSYDQKLNGNVAATEKELAAARVILQLNYTPISAANDDAATTAAAVEGK